MISLAVCLALVAFTTAKADWELVVSVGDHVELLRESGEVVGSRGRGLSSHMDSLALDTLTGLLYITDSIHPNTSIFTLRLDPPGFRPDPYDLTPKPLVNRGSRLVQGVAFDSIARAVYWTTGSEKRIMRVVVGTTRQARSVIPQQTEVVHSFEQEVPHGIAVDSCRRHLYWSNCNMGKPTIEKSGLNGGDRELIVSEDLFQPLGLTLSQGEGWLYWADERSGANFRIERVRLDGSSRQVLVMSSHQQPFSLAVVPGSGLFWTDLLQQAVWKIPLENLTFPIDKPNLIRQYSESIVPKGLVSLSQDTDLDSDQCNNLIKLRNQIGSWSSGAEPCPKDFCLNKGTCSPGLPKPTCNCQHGFLGDRCQYGLGLCAAFCLDVSSLTDLDLSSVCGCEKVIKTNFLNSVDIVKNDEVSNWQVATIALASITVIMVFTMVALVWKMLSLSKRPKLRRRYTVSRKPGPPPPPSHCEIDIENCCNMNICETPCYEPEFRTPKGTGQSKKEEKRSLIDGMQRSEATQPPCTLPSF